MKHSRLIAIAVLLCAISRSSFGQTDMDALMMKKNQFCAGVMYSYSSWEDYWEGTFKRDNQNLGTVSTQMIGVMGNYGVTNKLNVLFNLPYVSTKASAGTLRGMSGIQDLSMSLKWNPVRKKLGAPTLSLFALAGFSIPIGNYSPDFLPLSIGLQSRSVSGRVIADVKFGDFFVTGTGAYIHRANVKLDRQSYYTTQMHYTNEVKMPDVASYGARAGYRTSRWIAEAVVDRMNTLGGFDIRKNDMPFVSNEMDATQVGVNFKYTFKSIRGLELTGGARHTIEGRNVGQATTYNGGVFYVFEFAKK
jgi:hypothetical protein